MRSHIHKTRSADAVTSIITATASCLLRRLALIIVSSLGLASCEHLPMMRGYDMPKRALSLDPANAKYSSYKSPTRFNYVDPASSNYFRTVYDHPLRTVDGTPPMTATEEKKEKEAARKVIRNQIAKEMAALIDENHDIYHEMLRRNLTGTNIISDFLTMGLTTSGTITTGAQATRVLSGLATGTKGFGATLNSHVLQQQTLSALMKAIEIRKVRVYGGMKASFDKGSADYGLEDVIRDLGQYWQAGLLTAGVAELELLTSNKMADVNQAKANNAAAPPAVQGKAEVTATAPDPASVKP